MRSRIFAGFTVSVLLLTGCGNIGSTTSATSTTNQNSTSAVVKRVIDGDTVEMNISGSEDATRVRLLNVDTPETKHPNKLVECLGPEASDYLNRLLPAGTSVTLEYDQEKKDKYNRDLAGVFKDGQLVNAEIAREGLGTAVLFEPNDKFYQSVLDAQNQAEREGKGLFNPETSCTVAAKTQQMQSTLTNASTPEEAVAAVEEAQNFLDSITALSTSNTDFPHIYNLLKAHSIKDKTDKLNVAIKDKKEEIELQRKASEEKARAEKERAVEEQAEKDATAAEEAEYQGLMDTPNLNIPPAPVNVPETSVAPENPAQPPAPVNVPEAPAVPENPAQPPVPSPQPVPEQPAPAPEPKYTGCRSYAPGGKTWQPIPCPGQ